MIRRIVKSNYNQKFNS